MDSRGKNKKKFDFVQMKKNTLKSLNEVNCFLNSFSKACAIKKIIK